MTSTDTRMVAETAMGPDKASVRDRISSIGNHLLQAQSFCMSASMDQDPQRLAFALRTLAQQLSRMQQFTFILLKDLNQPGK